VKSSNANTESSILAGFKVKRLDHESIPPEAQIPSGVRPVAPVET